MGLLLDRARAVAVLVVLLGVSTTSVASAQTSAPVPVAGATSPALPAPVLIAAVGSDEIVVVNPTAEPLTVLDPGGRPFLRLSVDGVEADATAPFTYRSRHGADTATTLPPGVTDGAPPRWTRVSDDVSWRWHDPRLRPVTGPAPIGGRSDVRQVLAEWSVPLRYGDLAARVDGTLELRPRSGRFQTVVDPPPPGLAAVLPGGNRVLLTADGPVTVLGVDGEEFLRSTDRGWEVNPESRTHRLDLIAAGRSVPAAARGWLAHAGPGPVSWTDPRLDAPVEVDPAARAGGDVVRWSIPVRTGSDTSALTGAIRFVPDTTAAGGSTGSLGVPALVAGVAVLALLLAGLAARAHRRRPIERIPTP